MGPSLQLTVAHVPSICTMHGQHAHLKHNRLYNLWLFKMFGQPQGKRGNHRLNSNDPFFGQKREHATIRVRFVISDLSEKRSDN